ncbi:MULTISPECIES: general secretion pathway protein GspD [unclassified Janthinobacterium]|uniref:general secretion pathway protein GspD n=1 Tax=unclassified Janthinobacterium TaxID=2610881 RepID=UPI00182FE0DC|nr:MULTISPECIES: general secretion pathway protein GspD [unclassified Janthinobacterium]MBB5607491.1 general secretion pathway protein D [Janthinobacterium sp. S3T4]MBB5612512.1 general secretion pathway protein D [Janthinobacterium sp. S3M3]
MKPRTPGMIALLPLLSLLAACASNSAYDQGQAMLGAGRTEQGLALLEQAAQAEPTNAKYRIAATNGKMRALNNLNGRADALRQQGLLPEAQTLYRQALAIDASNDVALRGLDGVVQDERHRKQVAEAESVYKRGGEANLAQAQETLRQVLQERPSQRAALSLQSRISDEQARNRPAGGKLAAAYRKPVTLEFRDAPLRSVFDFISKVSGLNFVFDKEVDPGLRATISVRDTSIEEAIAMLLGANQLEQSVTSDKSITIYPNTPQKVKDYQQLVVRTFFLANADVKTVAYSIKTLLKARDIVTDERLGIIMLRDTPEMVRMAERIINVQDLADPEVMLEVEVLEVKRTRLMELGVRWPDQANLTLAGIGNGLGGLKVSDLRHINGDNINLGVGGVTLNANKTDSDSNILANPRIRVRNKEKAKILIGDRVPVITVTTNNGVSSDSVNYLDVGLKLDVEPNVYLDDEVAIKVNLEVSNVVKEVISKTGTQAYQIGTRSASTVLRLRDGETQVLAGLISDEDRGTANKVPGVGELPVLNRLFGSQKDDAMRSEIVLSITPRLLRSIRRPDLTTAEFNSGTETAVGGRASVGGGTDAASVPETPARASSPMTGGDDAPAAIQTVTPAANVKGGQ